MPTLSKEGQIEYAQKITLAAIENNLIPKNDDSKIAAENVLEFYETIFDGIKRIIEK